MSEALYGVESLRFYNEREIDFRDAFVKRLSSRFQTVLTGMNKAWRFFRVEGPLLTPQNFVSASYDADDIFITQIDKGSQKLVLRPETTVSSYLAAKEIIKGNMKNLPICVWQAGKSFRVEKSDGATAAKLRFNEFYQLEFQCIYANGTHADYRKSLIKALELELKASIFGIATRTVESDRLPEYSNSTIDVEVPYNSEFKEVASCSIRKDFEGAAVAEIAIGLDRLIEIYNQKEAMNDTDSAAAHLRSRSSLG
jgi:glycyl-tRNA synthetase